MASPNQASVSSDAAPTLRWSKGGDSGQAFSPPSRPSRGRSNRVRAGGKNGRGSQTIRQDPSTKPNDGSTSSIAAKSTKPLLPEKPILSITPASTSPSATKPKNSSRRPSRANSTISTSQSSPVIETPVSPASSRSSNRRRRSGAGKGNNIPKINPPASQDNLLRPGRPRFGPIPHTAPVKDTPIHLLPKPSHTPTGSFEMSKDIDALVERVRAIAMAENRPSTPGSHIDWAGDDDDSLPDLDDWGITSLSVPDQRAQAISPIIVGGLKPLPELTTSIGAAKLGVLPKSVDTPIEQLAATSSRAPQLENGEVSKQNHSYHPLPPKPPASSGDNIVQDAHPPRISQTVEENRATSDAVSTCELASEENVGQADTCGDNELKTTNEPHDSNASGDPDTQGSGGLADSVHAPLGHTELGHGGLAASIHAPHAIVDSTSAPAQLGIRHSRSRQTHGRAQTVGRPFPRPNLNENFNIRSSRNGRGGFHGSPKQHTRNHSSPATTSAGRLTHSRPVLTGDAMSRLAKAVNSTTSAKTTPVTND